jgi:hypothetical protein
MKPLYLFLFFLSHHAFALRDFEFNSTEYSQVVVFPDIHGDKHALLRSIWLAIKEVDGVALDYGLLTASFEGYLRTSAYDGPLLSGRKDIAVVQLGDVVDRGPYGVQCLYILSGIEKILGWNLYQLYGNHEILNFLDDAHQYISPLEWSFYSSVDHRRMEYSLGGRVHTHIVENSLGLVKLASAGNASTLFVHGGIDMEWVQKQTGESDINLANINRVFTTLASSGNKTEVEILNLMTSPVWTRAMAQAPEPEICTLVADIFRRFQVSRIVLGHTPQQDFQAKTRCDGTIVLADVMMSRWMVDDFVFEPAQLGGRPVAIVMTLDKEDGSLKSMVAHHTDLRGNLEESVVLIGDKSLEKLPSFTHLDSFSGDDEEVEDAMLLKRRRQSSPLRRTTSMTDGLGELFFPKTYVPLPSYMRSDSTTSLPSSEDEFEEHWSLGPESSWDSEFGFSIFTEHEDAECLGRPPTPVQEEATRIVAPIPRRNSPLIRFDLEPVVKIETPILKTIVAMHEGRAAVYDSTFRGESGLTHVLLNGKEPDLDILLKLATTLETAVPYVGTMMAPPFVGVPPTKQVSFFFVSTLCTTSIDELPDAFFSEEFAHHVAHTIQDVASRLVTNGLILGQQYPIDAFAVCSKVKTVQLGDWSRVRNADSKEELDRDFETINLAVSQFLQGL